jgi:hypothetical protein
MVSGAKFEAQHSKYETNPDDGTTNSIMNHLQPVSTRLRQLTLQAILGSLGMFPAFLKSI